MFLTGLTAAAAAASGIYKMIQGSAERTRGRKDFENMDAPDYRDSEAYNTAERTVGTARRQMESGLPDEIVNRREQTIDRGFAAGLDATGRGGLDADNLFGSLSDAYGNLAAQEGKFALAKQDAFLKSIYNLQGAQDKAYDIDLGEFKTKQAEALGRVKAGRESFNSGIQDIISAGALGIEGGIWDESPLKKASGGRVGMSPMSPRPANTGFTPKAPQLGLPGAFSDLGYSVGQGGVATATNGGMFDATTGDTIDRLMYGLELYKQ